jgi:hypothetical protein
VNPLSSFAGNALSPRIQLQEVVMTNWIFTLLGLFTGGVHPEDVQQLSDVGV